MTKKLAAVAVVILLLAALCAPALAEETEYGIMMVDHCKEWVSLRARPDANSKRLAKVPLYDLVTDAKWKPAYGKFILCSYQGKEGYILAQYLEPWADPEKEEEERFDSALGFSFYYNPSLMTVDETQSENGQSLLIDTKGTQSPVYLEIMTPAGVGTTPWKFLTQNLPSGAKYTKDATENGAEMRWFQKASVNNRQITETYFALQDGENGLVAVGTWPAEDDEAWREGFIDLMRTLRFAPAAPVRVDWAEATKNAVVVDRDGEYVTIMADEAVTHAALLSLDLKDIDKDGNAVYQTETVLERETIGPDTPLVVKIAFPGDMPGYGIRFTDGQGKVWQFALVLSGRDGALELEPF